MAEMQVPVLIVGGGGAGLSSSMLLSHLGIESLLVTRYAETSRLPKAHVLNQRTMEILRELGIADEVYRRGTPPEHMQATAWYAGLAGDRPEYGQELGRTEVWGGGYRDPDYVAASSCPTTNLPQIRLEPILRRHAESLAPGRVRFGHELLELTQDDDGVTATVVDHRDGSRFSVRAQYVIGADGGRTVGEQIGVRMEGERDLMRLTSVHMEADLSQWSRDPEVLIRWFINPDFGGSWASGVIVPMGPERWGGRSEEWVMHFQSPMDDTAVFDEANVLERMRRTLGIADFSPKIHKISQWVMEALLAERFQVGRVFLVGDAAHRHPPTGGLGLNGAIHDAHNLCWKLAEVLAGRASASLLETYHDERRPVDEANVQLALASAMNHFKIDEALGLSPENTAEENWDVVRPLFEDLPDSPAKRHALNRAIGSQTMEFRHHNVDFGYRYDSAAVIGDDTADREPLDPVRLYEPRTIPGRPLPHAFVERAGERMSLAELVNGNFLLIAGEEGHDWVDAARAIAERSGIPLSASRIGVLDGDHVDIRCAWLKHREIGPRGAVLVRPDRCIGWRSLDGSEAPEADLEAALAQILGTGMPVATAS